MKNQRSKKIRKKIRKKRIELPSKAKLRGRINIIMASMALITLVLGGKVAYITFFKDEIYSKGVLDNMLQNERMIEAPRGIIQDVNGRTLAASILSYNIILSPYEIINHVPKEETRQKIYQTLATTLGMDASTIQLEVEKRAGQPTGNKYYMLAERITEEKAEPLKGLSGVTVQSTYIRQYPNQTLAAQVLGYYNKEGKGRYGIEQQYHNFLEGQAGRTFSQIQKYQIVNTELQAPVPGATVTLTLDSVIQKYIADAMEPYIKETQPKTATCIIMRPKTAEVLGMYSYPSYNPNTYNNLSEQLGDQWSSLSQQEQSTALLSAWKNNAIQLNYEPGSTFKPLIVAMALEEGVITEEETYTCNGSKKVAGEKTIHCWKREGHGVQTLTQALANSCNVALMDIGEKMDNADFLNYVKNYGFGAQTGIELAGEEQGQLHSTLGPVEKATYCIGQTLTVTPIQLISAFSAVINGGYLMQPYVVSEITDQEGRVLLKQEPTVRHQIISSDIADYVTEALQKVVDEGTGNKATVPGYQVGGKTGTGQQWIKLGNKMVRDEENYVISFMGFAPVEDPEIIGLVVFEGIPEGTGANTYAFRDMMKNIFPYLDIPTSAEAYEPDEATSTVPDVAGKTIYDAVSTLDKKGYTYQILGSGVQINEQYPKGGHTWNTKQQSVTLYATTDKPEELREVPNLVGKTVEEAQAIAKVVDLVVEGKGSGKITKQFPNAGFKVEAGNKIIIHTEN